MMAAADSIGRRNGAARWGGSLLLVLLLHLGAGLYLASRHVLSEAITTPPAAVMIDLAPLPVAPPAPPVPTPPTELPPEPRVVPPPEPPPIAQTQPEPVPLPPPPMPDVPTLEPTPVPNPEVALPAPPPPHPKAEPRPVQPPKPAPKPLPRPAVRPPPTPMMPSPPVQAPVMPRPVPPVYAPPQAAPAPAAPAVNSGAARASWQAQVASQLERNKRYPRLAQEQREEGTATVQFAIDRQGRVLSARIVQGSGFTLLDEEALALLQRAQPLPAPPPELPGATIEITVPLRFSIRPGGR